MLLAWASAEISVRVGNPKQAHNTEKRLSHCENHPLNSILLPLVHYPMDVHGY